MNTMTNATTLPDLPLTCCRSADLESTATAFTGKNTVIDFWTVRCTRCPDALDKLEKMAKDPKYASTKFASICLGAPEEGCDVTREILETPDDAPRWDAIHHFFMDFKSKEKAKKILGFSSVPFYIFLNEEGEIEQTGNTKAIDFDRIPGVEKKDDPVIIPVANVDSSGERVLILDEDF